MGLRPPLEHSCQTQPTGSITQHRSKTRLRRFPPHLYPLHPPHLVTWSEIRTALLRKLRRKPARLHTGLPLEVLARRMAVPILTAALCSPPVITTLVSRLEGVGTAQPTSSIPGSTTSKTDSRRAQTQSFAQARLRRFLQTTSTERSSTSPARLNPAVRAVRRVWYHFLGFG